MYKCTCLPEHVKRWQSHGCNGNKEKIITKRELTDPKKGGKKIKRNVKKAMNGQKRPDTTPEKINGDLDAAYA